MTHIPLMKYRALKTYDMPVQQTSTRGPIHNIVLSCYAIAYTIAVGSSLYSAGHNHVPRTRRPFGVFMISAHLRLKFPA
jgi:hypothetical protein